MSIPSAATTPRAAVTTVSELHAAATGGATGAERQRAGRGGRAEASVLVRRVSDVRVPPGGPQVSAVSERRRQGRDAEGLQAPVGAASA